MTVAHGKAQPTYLAHKVPMQLDAAAESPMTESATGYNQDVILAPVQHQPAGR